MPQCAMTHSGSCSSALAKHLTPSDLLKAKHQFKPRLNQRWASGAPVEIVLLWLPRLKRSISPTPASRGAALADASQLDSRCLSSPLAKKRQLFIMSRQLKYV